MKCSIYCAVPSAFVLRIVGSSRGECLSVLLCCFLASACSSGVRAAGHTVAAPDPSTEHVEGRRGEVSGNRIISEEQGDTAKGGRNSPRTDPQREPQPLFAQVPEGGRLIGKSGKISLEAWGAGGHWVAYCRPRHGEGTSNDENPRRAQYATDLFLQIGEEERPIDALLRRDDTGRYLVSLEDGKAWLVDSVITKRWDLSLFEPDLRADSLPDHRSFAFAGGGLVVLSASQKVDAFFVPLPSTVGGHGASSSPLESAQEVTVGAGEVWRVKGGLESAVFVRSGVEHGSQSWPAPIEQKPVRRCGSSPSFYPAFTRLSSFRPDPHLETSWLSLLGKGTKRKRPQLLKAQPAPGFVMGFGDGWVRREDTGRLLWVSAGTQKQIASARCGARILHVDEKSGLFLISCEEYRPVATKKKRVKGKRPKPKYRFELYLVRPGYVRDLRADIARTGVDVAGAEQSNLLPIRPGAVAAFVDFEKRKLRQLDGQLQVLSVSGDHALLRRGREFSLWSEDGEENIDIHQPLVAPILSAGRAVAVGNEFFLLQKELRTWSLPAAPLAVSRQGYALIPKIAGTTESWAEGPLLLLGPPADE